MPLILAVQPDRKEAAKIVAIARGSLGADIVVTDSADQALASLAKTVPDLVLISQLLSPKDDQAITDRLRQLDTAGVSVQTLVIPILGSPGRGSQLKQPGLLGRLRRNRTSVAAPDGCDPDVFAAQITEYLERAAAEREAARAESAVRPLVDAHRMVPVAAPVDANATVTAAMDDASAPAADDGDDIDDVLVSPVNVVADPADEIVAASVEADDMVMADVVEQLEEPVFEKVAAAPVEEVAAAAVSGIEDIAKRAVEQTVDEAPTAHLEAFTHPPDWEDIDLDSADSDALVLTAEAIDIEAFLRELEGNEGAPPPMKVPEPVRAPAPVIVNTKSVEKSKSVGRPEPPSWGLCAWPRLEGEMVADLALETDFEIAADPELAEFAAALQVLPEAAEEDDEGLWMPLATQPDYVWPRMESAAVAAPAPTPAPSRTKAPQDEWGLFDPDQCGMPAVMKRVSLIEAQEPRR